MRRPAALSVVAFPSARALPENCRTMKQNFESFAISRELKCSTLGYRPITPWHLAEGIRNDLDPQILSLFHSKMFSGLCDNSVSSRCFNQFPLTGEARTATLSSQTLPLPQGGYVRHDSAGELAKLLLGWRDGDRRIGSPRISWISRASRCGKISSIPHAGMVRENVAVTRKRVGSKTRPSRCQRKSGVRKK